MATTFLDLIGPKTNARSIQNYVNYKKVPVEVVLEEAQALIYSQLRVREMRASSVLVLPAGAFNVLLPDNFLEPIALRDREGISLIPNRGEDDTYLSEAVLTEKRSHDPDALTTLSAAITTTTATSISLTDGSVFTADMPFPIVIDAEQLLVTAGGGTNTLTVTRGFAGTTAATHANGATVDGQLLSGVPCFVSIFDERYQFDCWASEARRYSHVFYQRPALLSPTNPTNFLTNRYPNVVRVACQAGAASYMKDAEEWKAREAELLALIAAANAESDLSRAS